jgi:hypothetical protein
MTKAEILEAVSAWLDQAAEPQSTDKSLLIEKIGYVKSKISGQLEAAEFIVRVTANVAQALVPVPRIQTTLEKP